MKLEITNNPLDEDTDYIENQTSIYNSQFTKMDFTPLSVFVRDDVGIIIAGLTAHTYWGLLHVQYLWVHEDHRKKGIAGKLMLAAENEAVKRGCKQSTLDTFSFQALGFYKKLGYSEFGKLSGYRGKHTRHFLQKKLEE